MFYKMIENKCKEWYSSNQCTVNPIIDYIEKTGQMRDAQIEAIKIYLFLKIGCECKPLEFLFRELFSKLRSTMKSCMNMQNAGL